jgi:hypothetical protein
MAKEAPKKRGKHVFNHMERVLCPTNGTRPQWANNSVAGWRCTKCGQTGHQVVH